ncbi:MAG TPA: XdhC family protein [Actinocrinis sp.]|jgi:xanthine dehydrogenase accessory factor
MTDATTPSALDRRMADLAAARTAFVRATVVRARRPTSARPGDRALVLEDGRIEGFVGGVCAEATVRLHALRALGTGEPLLLRISPDTPADPDEAQAEPEDGALNVGNPCLSGGELEIFLEPWRPAPLVFVLGETPIGRALVGLGAVLDYDVRALSAAGFTPEALAGAAAVVAASHGRDEEAVLARAACCDVPYVALVSSPRRGRAVVAGLDLTPEQRERIRTPAGLWIGARTPGEVALSILAEFIAQLRGVSVKSDGESATEHEPVAAAGPATAVDPVCGMTVAVVADAPCSDAGGERRWFCREACRDAFEAEPERYAAPIQAVPIQTTPAQTAEAR